MIQLPLAQRRQVHEKRGAFRFRGGLEIAAFGVDDVWLSSSSEGSLVLMLVLMMDGSRGGCGGGCRHGRRDDSVHLAGF